MAFGSDVRQMFGCKMTSGKDTKVLEEGRRRDREGEGSP